MNNEILILIITIFKVIEKSDETIQVSEFGGIHTLRIANVETKHFGNFVIIAENSLGSDKSTATLTAQNLSVINSLGIEKTPVFTKLPQDHTTEEGNSVKFSAVVTGNPQPSISWYLNQELIVSSEEKIRVKYEHDTGKTSIRIFSPEISQVFF